MDRSGSRPFAEDGQATDISGDFRGSLAERVSALTPLLDGPVPAEQPGETRLLDADSLLAYQEIQRLKLELEIEAATVLRRAAETVSALQETIVALRPATNGHSVELETLAVVDRRGGVEWLRDRLTEPVGTAANGEANGHAANGHVANGHANGHAANGDSAGDLANR